MEKRTNHSEWPSGLAGRCRLTVEPAHQQKSLGIADADWPTTPEDIAVLLTKMDALEPLEMSPEEESDFWAWRQKVEEYTLANMEKDIAGLPERGDSFSIPELRLTT